jgi:hypothetical protein
MHSSSAVIIDMPEAAHEHMGVNIPTADVGSPTEDPEDLISRFAKLDPTLTDTTGVKSKGIQRFTAMVTKLLDFKQTRTDPKARAAVKKEGRALADVGTWDEASVRELEDLLREVEKTGGKIHIVVSYSVSVAVNTSRCQLPSHSASKKY